MKVSKLMIAGALLGMALSTGTAVADTNAPLTPAVEAQLNAATTVDDIATLINANPGLEATIIARALATGVFSVEDIVDAAVIASPSNVAAIVEAATEAAPDQASGIVFTAASAAGLQLGAEGDETDASIAAAIAQAAVRGIEAAYDPNGEQAANAVRSVAAELFPFLGEDNRLALAGAIAEETTVATDTAESVVQDIETAATEDNNFEGDNLLEDGEETETAANSSSE